MARCGCGGSACSCRLIAGSGVTITGNGSASNPYVVSATGSGTDDMAGTIIAQSNGSTTPVHVAASDPNLTVFDVVDITAPVVAGRKYRLDAGGVVRFDAAAATGYGYTVSASGPGQMNNLYTGDGQGQTLSSGALAPSPASTYAGPLGVGFFQAVVTGDVTLELGGYIQGTGTVDFAPHNVILTLTDCGV